MQHCIYCGTDLPANARFCGVCGREQADTTVRDASPTVSSASFTPPRQAGENAPALLSSSRASLVPANEQEKDDRALLAPLPYPPVPAGPPPAAPFIAGAPPAAGVPAVTGTPGTLTSAASMTAKVGMSAAAKWAIVAVVVVVIVAGTGIGLAAYHFATLPKPVISAASQYHAGGVLAGASDTTLRVDGQKFSANSPITFLLDGKPLALKQVVTSDASGTFQAKLTVMPSWPPGAHTLTARDGNNYTTQKGIQIEIVPQGAANTPGPLGAPPDDASFQIAIALQYTTNGQSYTGQSTGIVTGHPDPAGGSVCEAYADGKPHVYIEKTLNTGLGYRDTSTYSCNGTYKSGKIALTEMLLADKIEFAPYGSAGVCTLASPQVDEQLSGSYTGNNTFSGTLTYPGIPRSLYSCTLNWYFFRYSGQGTWTGQITNQS